jgi:hypothetical protein
MGVHPMNHWKVRILAVLAALAFSATAEAGVSIDWDPVNFYAPPSSTPSNQPLGNSLTGVGTVSAFGAPFQFLNAQDPTREYTIYVSGLVSLGTVTIGAPGLQFYTTNYSGGTIQIYEDLSPDHAYGVNPPNGTAPSTFQDGTLLLAGSFTRFLVQTNDFTAFQVGNAEGDIAWTGGSLLPLTFLPGGAPCPGLFTGGLTWRTSVVPQGYLFTHDGKIDLNCPVPTQPSTWGKLKGQYR